MSAASDEAMAAREGSGLGDLAGRAGGVGTDHRPDAEGAQRLPALAERLDMALRRADLGQPGALHADQLVMHRQEMFADDVHVGFRQDVVDVGDAAGRRVLDRNHAEVAGAGGQCRKAVLEGRAGDRLAIGIDLEGGEMGIGARLALEHDFQLFRHRSLPLFDRQSGIAATSQPVIS